ncbi:hypothetical protein [Nocardia africana]
MTTLAASTRYAKHYRWRKANGITLYTDATPARFHIADLADLGVTHAMVAAASGYAEHTIMEIANGATSKLQHETAAKILAVTHIPHPAQKLVPAVGAKRRIRALNAIGWPTSDLADRLGTSMKALSQSINRPYVTYSRWAAIRNLYEELSGTPGPNPDTARHVRIKPVPPLAWEGRDIDHPLTQPDWAAAGGRPDQARKCRNNHKYTPDNVVYVSGVRRCRQCDRDTGKRFRKRTAET